MRKTLCLVVLCVGAAKCYATDLKMVAAARAQIGVTLLYDPAYRTLAYPNGDVPADRGVCTDVVIRALRAAYAYDLQSAVHEDMKRNFAQYPNQWALKKPDRNIDHRRVPNLQCFFRRRGWRLVETEADYEPGDFVTCRVPPNLPHIMVVSDVKTEDGRCFVIHNIGRGAQEEDCLDKFKITGHYRRPVAKPEAPASGPQTKAKAP